MLNITTSRKPNDERKTLGVAVIPTLCQDSVLRVEDGVRVEAIEGYGKMSHFDWLSFLENKVCRITETTF